MSKSLKNFVTVREMLSDFSADEFRMFLLLHHYRSTLVYSQDRMEDAASVLHKFHSFKDWSGKLLGGGSMEGRRRLRWSSAEQQLHDQTQNHEAQFSKIPGR